MSTEILLVCDDQNLIQKGKAQLEREGYYVTCSASIEEAAELCRDDFDMVVVAESLSDSDMHRFIREVHSVCLSPILALRQGNEAPVAEADYSLNVSVDSLELGRTVSRLLTRAKAA